MTSGEALIDFVIIKNRKDSPHSVMSVLWYNQKQTKKKLSNFSGHVLLDPSIANCDK